MEFQLNDRVKVLQVYPKHAQDYQLSAGMTGTVMYIGLTQQQNVLVKLDNWTRGHGAGHACWYFPSDFLTLVKESQEPRESGKFYSRYYRLDIQTKEVVRIYFTTDHYPALGSQGVPEIGALRFVNSLNMLSQESGFTYWIEEKTAQS